MPKVITMPGVQAITPTGPEAADTRQSLGDHRFDLIACLIEEIGTEAHQMDGLCEVVSIEDGAPKLVHALHQSMRRIGALADAAIRHGHAGGHPLRDEGAWALPEVCRDTLAEIRKVEASTEAAR